MKGDHGGSGCREECSRLTMCGIVVISLAAAIPTPTAGDCQRSSLEEIMPTLGYPSDRQTCSVLQRGQLGHGDTTQRNYPSIVTGLAGRNIVTGQPCCCCLEILDKIVVVEDHIMCKNPPFIRLVHDL